MYTSVSSHVGTRYLLLPILFCCIALSVFRLCYFSFPNHTFQCFFRLLLLPQPRSNLPLSLHNPFPWFYPCSTSSSLSYIFDLYFFLFVICCWHVDLITRPISTGSDFILTLIILLPYLSISTMDLAIFSSTRTATPFWPFSPPVWIILTPSLVKSPSSFHLVSAIVPSHPSLLFSTSPLGSCSSDRSSS